VAEGIQPAARLSYSLIYYNILRSIVGVGSLRTCELIKKLEFNSKRKQGNQRQKTSVLRAIHIACIYVCLQLYTIAAVYNMCLVVAWSTSSNEFLYFIQFSHYLCIQ